MTGAQFLAMGELEAGLELIRQSPKSEGRLELIVRRPHPGEREVLQEGVLNLAEGLVGDNWRTRGNSRPSPSPSRHDLQVTIMNSRVIALISPEKARWPLAGDQLFIDLDLSEENVPAGTQLALGSAVIEVTAEPHTGCKKFVGRFGVEAMKFVNSPVGRQLHLRGINAKVVQAGVIRVHDMVKKYHPPLLAYPGAML